MNVKPPQSRLLNAIVLILLGLSFTFPVAAQPSGPQNSVQATPPGDYVDKMKQGVEAMNVPIAFYGIVVDQNNEPLTDVKIVLSVQQRYFDPIYIARDRNPRFKRATRADGRFFLGNVSGKNVEIESMTKSGYEAELLCRKVS